MDFSLFNGLRFLSFCFVLGSCDYVNSSEGENREFIVKPGHLWEYVDDSRDTVRMVKTIDHYPLFPILFKKAGYVVNFFSNQYIRKGFSKGATNQSGHFFLADSELSDSLFSYRNLKVR